MAKLPQFNGHEVLNVLVQAGFYVHHQVGSHARLFHRYKPAVKVTIPVHTRDLPEKTLRTILRQARISDDEFLKLWKRQEG